MSSLKILTIDGGGLQALTTLSILNDICVAIGKSSGSERVPAPYELFDVIGGIGTGGWLALLLGRFRLDIVTCMSVYMEIAKAIDPQSELQNGCRRTPSSGYRLNQKKLMVKIDQVLEKYSLDKHLLDSELAAGTTTEDAQHVRCKHVFAAGVINNGTSKDDREYHIFRTYPSNPPATNAGKDYRDGPNPKTCKISEACAATGAAQYFLKPCKIGNTSYFDADFPHPHKISSLALDEAYSIFGEEAALSLILNVGPSLASDSDLKELRASSTSRIMRLARKFSWPKITTQTNTTAALTTENLATTISSISSQGRTATSSSLASDTETRLREGIKERLKKRYLHGDRLYHHIGPVERFAKDSLCLNDVSAMNLSNEEVDKFRADPQAKSLIQEAALQYIMA